MLAEYERKNDLVILDPSEYESLNVLCEQAGDLELGPTDLFQFLS